MYTGYFANMNKYQAAGLIPVAISRYLPEGYIGFSYQELAPTADLLKEWKYGPHKGDTIYYRTVFTETTLNLLESSKVCADLAAVGELDKVILICYETPGKFCHRHLVADWLQQHGVNCTEY